MPSFPWAPACRHMWHKLAPSAFILLHRVTKVKDHLAWGGSTMYCRKQCDKSKFACWLWKDISARVRSCNQAMQQTIFRVPIYLRRKKVRTCRHLSASEVFLLKPECSFFIPRGIRPIEVSLCQPDGVAFRAFFLCCPHFNLYATKVSEHNLAYEQEL